MVVNLDFLLKREMLKARTSPSKARTLFSITRLMVNGKALHVLKVTLN